MSSSAVAAPYWSISSVVYQYMLFTAMSLMLMPAADHGMNS